MPMGSMTYAAPMTYSTPMEPMTYATAGAGERYNVSPEVFEKLLRGEAVSEEEIMGAAPATEVVADTAAAVVASKKAKKSKKVAKVSKKKSKGCC